MATMKVIHRSPDQRHIVLWILLLVKSNLLAIARKLADVFALLVFFAARQLGRRP
jgi:hypothetical protein